MARLVSVSFSLRLQAEAQADRIMESRAGAVLGPFTILKEDYFPGMKSNRLPQTLAGASNFRCMKGNHVYGVAMSTLAGIKNVLREVKNQQGEHQDKVRLRGCTSIECCSSLNKWQSSEFGCTGWAVSPIFCCSWPTEFSWMHECTANDDAMEAQDFVIGAASLLLFAYQNNQILHCKKDMPLQVLSLGSHL